MTTSSNPLRATPQFEVSVDRRDKASVVHVSGEVDIATAPRLTAALRDAAADGVALLIADLSQVSLLDSTGLGALIEAQQAADPLRLRLVVSAPHVLKIFSVTGLDQVFTICGSLDEALRAGA